MARWRRYGIVFMSAALLGWGGWQYAAHKHKDRFDPAGIQFDLPFNPAWEAEPLTEDERAHLASLLNQRFYYLSKGARSYAFESEDGLHVLKFFKYRYAVPHWTVRYLPPIPPFEYFRQKKIHKVSLETVLNGNKLAYDKDPAGTGMLYVHLNPSPIGLPSVAVIDKGGRTHVIDLNATRFVLQKKVVELGALLDGYLQEGKIDAARDALYRTIDRYLSHYRQGIYDTGIGLIRNNGFLNGDPIHFDVGKMTLDPRVQDREFQYRALEKMVDNAERWIKRKHPDDAEALNSALRSKLHAVKP